MNSITIANVSLHDIDTLRAISHQTFYETFAAVNSEENMQQYLDKELSVEKLLSELQQPGSSFYFAILDDQPIGYLKLNTGSAQTELKEESGLEIERIYVVKEFLGKQVGKLLYEYAVDIATKEQKSYIWLGVWEENKRAIAFYTKNGFIQFDQHIFRLGEDEQVDIMMRKEL